MEILKKGGVALPSCLVGLVCALVYAPGARAEYPDRPVHIIVGFAPGGGGDTVARLVSAKLSEKWGQPVVVENRDGASGSISSDVVAHAAPDGYMLNWINNSHTITPNLFKLNYDAVKSFAPISLAVEEPQVLVTLPSFPANTLQELIAQTKANPGHLNFGSAGTGSPPFLAMLLLNEKTGMEMVSVPYKGGSEISVGLMGGAIDLSFQIMETAVPQVKAGKFKALAVTTKTRAPLLPDVPTVAEAAHLPDFEAGVYDGLLAPAGTPGPIVAKLNRDLVDVLKTPEIRGRLAEMGWDVIADTPAEFTSRIRSDIAMWGNVLKSVKH